jgi:hypothetical protein
MLSGPGALLICIEVVSRYRARREAEREQRAEARARA